MATPGKPAFAKAVWPAASSGDINVGFGAPVSEGQTTSPATAFPEVSAIVVPHGSIREKGEFIAAAFFKTNLDIVRVSASRLRGVAVLALAAARIRRLRPRLLHPDIAFGLKSAPW